MKILNAKVFTETLSVFILTPFKWAKNRYSMSCLVCATELTQYTTYGKSIWWSINYFEEYNISFNTLDLGPLKKIN